VGNLVDRLRFGGVVDFLDFRIWPVFNAADSCITIGAALLAVSFWRKN
jgi:signal peptidase II